MPRITSRLSTLSLAMSLLLSSIVTAAPATGESQGFVDKQYDIQGNWAVIEKDGRAFIRFSQDFQTKEGPDLKVFLSPATIEEANGKNATDGSVLLGELVSSSGTQDYALPEGVDLNDFQSVLVHCEEFSVLWGGGAF